jgi:hypothetical protein
LSGILLGTVPEEIKHFNERHTLFVERFANIKAALDTAFTRTVQSLNLVDPVIFYLGRLCIEDFNEILVLCANGYGYGASKLIRGMFERAVTGLFLHFHPDEVQAFLDFYWVSQRKEMNNLKESFGPTAISEEASKEIEEHYRKVVSQFEITACAKCKTKRINHTWSKFDLVAMTKDVQTQSKIAMQKFVFEAYLRPLRYAHSTIAALLSRLEQKDADTVFFDHQFQRLEADAALKTAHRLIILTLMLQAIHFKTDTLDEHWQKLVSDFAQVWGITEDSATEQKR